jgi:L-2-hydroxyglutarate oxidase LhgO
VNICSALHVDGPRFQNRNVKGDYNSYSGKERQEHLIYPLSEKDGLGGHVMMDMSGQVRFDSLFMKLIRLTMK